MKTLKTGLQAAFLLVAGLFLSGCDKLKEIDALKGEVATDKQQMVELKAELATRKQQMVELKDELATVNWRLAALETAQRKGVSNRGPQTIPAEQTVMLKKTISQCVQVVRGSAPKGEFKDLRGLPQDEVYAKFDAFYNPASGRVQNNNQYVDQSAVYAFNKCMASEGWPLN